MEPVVKVKFLYEETQVTVRIHITLPSEENCLSWANPYNTLLETIEIQQRILQKVTETAFELSSYNQQSASKFLELSTKIEKYPSIVKSMCDDLKSIQKSIHRMKQKLGLPKYRIPDD